MKRFLKHILFWIAVFFFYIISYTYDENYYMSAIANMLNVPLFMVAYYTLYYIQIPLLYNKKKYVLFGISLVVSSFIISVSCKFIGIYYLNDLTGHVATGPFMSLAIYLTKSIRFYTPAIAIIAYKSHKERLAEKDQLQLLRQEKIETELKFLKAQLNPHFLFNTLNNLYSFIINNSPKAGDMVLRLSEILDYILYKSQTRFVFLSQEINHIENYIELEKIRYGDRLSVSFEKGDKPLQNKVAPLLFLSIIENAFKHGASGSIEKPIIKISVKETGEVIHFRVWNTKREIESAALNDEYKEGIGLSNIKRQLNLIYPNQHQLITLNESNFFELTLTINTEEHVA